MTTFYQLSATSLGGQLVPMSDYAGRLVLVVNTASRCGFTPQYTGLEDLYKNMLLLVWWCWVFPAISLVTRSPAMQKT